jgi:hypothetical protein
LVIAIMSLPDDNWSTFFISTSRDIKASVGILEVAEVVSLILENLPPSGVGAPDLEVVWSSWAGNVPWLVVELSSNCQRFLVEPPCLIVSSVLCLNDNVSVINDIKISVGW